MYIRELIEGLKEGKTVLNPLYWGREGRLSIRENHLIDEEGDSLCNPVDDIALCVYFQDVNFEGAYFEEEQKESKESKEEQKESKESKEEQKESKEILISENYIKLRDEVAKDIFYFRMSRRASATLEENATFAFKAAEAFMKARNNA